MQRCGLYLTALAMRYPVQSKRRRAPGFQDINLVNIGPTNNATYLLAHLGLYYRSFYLMQLLLCVVSKCPDPSSRPISPLSTSLSWVRSALLTYSRRQHFDTYGGGAPGF